MGAFSKDLITWEKLKQPVLQRDEALTWMQAYVAEPSLLALPDGSFLLFFTAFSDWESSPPVIGVAHSKNPFGPWHIRTDPIVVADDDWRSTWVGAPEAILLDNEIWLYYTGVDSQGVARIGLARARLAQTELK